MVKKSRKGQSGGTTIEVTIIFPLVFLSFIALIFLCILLYQQTRIKAIAHTLAEKGEMISKEEIQKYQEEGIEVSSTIKQSFLRKQIIVEAKKTYPIALGGMLKLFGIPKNAVVKETAESIMHNPAGFLRTIDFGVETIEDVDGWSGGKMSVFINQMMENIKEFF
jgi:hypothetical protein